MKTLLVTPLQLGLSSKRILFTHLLLPVHKKAKYWGHYIKICSVSGIKALYQETHHDPDK